MDPTKLCFGSPFSFYVFFFVVCFVKLSDPAALKLNNNNKKKKKKKKKKKWPQQLNLSSFLLRYIYI